MGFDFFKKKDGKSGKGGGDDSPFADDLEFDDIETSGEFLSGSEEQNSAPPPPPPPQRSAPYQPPSPPPSPVQHPRPVTPPPAYPPSPSPSPYSPSAGAEPVDNDITIVNRPPVTPPGSFPPRAPAPPHVGHQGPVPPQAARAPGPPAPPARPAHPVPPPAAPPVVPPPGHQPDGLADDEVTQVLNKPVSSEAVVAWLVVADGTMRGEDFRLPSGTARLGQHPRCDIRISGDTFVSTQHAEFRFQGGVYWVYDLASTNGLFLNGSRIEQASLTDGDNIKAGTTTLVFKCVNI
jgi:hypothetical protein